MNGLDDKLQVWIAHYCTSLRRDIYNSLYVYLLKQPLYHQFIIYERVHAAYMNKILPITDLDKFTEFCERHIQTTQKLLILVEDWIQKNDETKN